MPVSPNGNDPVGASGRIMEGIVKTRRTMTRHTCSRSVLGIALSVALSLAAANAAPLSMPRNPMALAKLYGDGIDFDILRNGSQVGRQTVDFSIDGDQLVVKTMSDIAVKLLFVTVYRFHYESESRWEAGQLQDLTADTSDDGKTSQTIVRRDANGAIIDGPAGRFEVPAPVFPGEHWDIDEVRQSALLNSITGRLDHVAVADAGPDEVETSAGPHKAERYVYSGDLRLTAWYDAAGRWVGLRFTAKDGSVIDYRCRRCGIGGGAG